MAPGTSPLTLSRDSLGPLDAGGNRCSGNCPNVQPSAFGLLQMESSYLPGSDLVVVENESCSSRKVGGGFDECIVLKPPSQIPLMMVAADMDEDGSGNGLELNGVGIGGGAAAGTNEPGGLTELMSSLNLNWDYVTQLQEKYLVDDGGEDSEDLSELSNNNVYASKIRPPPIPTFAPYYHPACPGSRHFRIPHRNQQQQQQNPSHIQLERKSSLDDRSSSAGGSDNEESTLKEIFGQVRYDEWMAPLASSETLSEISSLRSSRASFFLPKDQSPLLMRVRGGSRNGGTSSSLHRHNNKGRRGLACFFGGGSASVKGTGLKRGHHNRSLSCTYPENTQVSIISFSAGLFGNGTKTCVLPPRIRACKKKGAAVAAAATQQNVGCWKCATTEESVESTKKIAKSAELGTQVNDNLVVGGMEERQIVNEMCSSTSSATCQRLGENESAEEAVDPKDGSQLMGEQDGGEGVHVDGFGRASFSIKKMFDSKDSGCSSFGAASNGGSTTATAAIARYVPVYPTFSNQQEYGVPEYSHPHFNYPSQTPPLSPGVIVVDDSSITTFNVDTMIQTEKTSNRPNEVAENSVVLELDCIEQHAADDSNFRDEC